MFKIQRKLIAPETGISFGVFLLGLGITILGSLLSPDYYFWRSFGTALGTALLGAAFVALVYFLLGYLIFKREIAPFEEFWGQKFEDKVPGQILLQADPIELLAQQFASARRESLDIASTPEKATNENRTYKARAWINRFDTEGAKNIRETFADLGFTPPLFRAIERGRKYDSSGSFEISMGLGFTDAIKERVNRVCRGVLSVAIDDMYGDIIKIHRTCLPTSWPDELKPPTNTSMTDPCPLIPEGWDHSKYLNLEQQNGGITDYGYIFRYKAKGAVSSKSPIIFHVGGFTEQGTWAAGHYLATRWRDIYKTHVKGERESEENRTVILLAGKIPFHQDRQESKKMSTWRWREIHLHNISTLPRNQL